MAELKPRGFAFGNNFRTARGARAPRSHAGQAAAEAAAALPPSAVPRGERRGRGSVPCDRGRPVESARLHPLRIGNRGRRDVLIKTGETGRLAVDDAAGESRDEIGLRSEPLREFRARVRAGWALIGLIRSATMTPGGIPGGTATTSSTGSRPYLSQDDRLPRALHRSRPGEIRAATAGRPAGVRRAVRRDLADFERILLPGITHWNHPGFFALLRHFRQRAGRAGGIVLIGALNVQAMLWRQPRPPRRTGGGGARWLRATAGPARRVRRREFDQPLRASLHAAWRARADGGRADVPRAGLADADCRRAVSTRGARRRIRPDSTRR